MSVTDIRVVMGWEPVYWSYDGVIQYPEPGPNIWKLPDGVSSRWMGTEVTVDDLLTWLLDNGPEWISMNNAYNDEGAARDWQVSCADYSGDGYNEPTTEHDVHEADGPSLLVALTALVRQVASDG